MLPDVPVHPCLVEAATTLTRESLAHSAFLRKESASKVGAIAGVTFKTIYRAIAEAIGDRIRPRNLSEAIDAAFETTPTSGVGFSEATQREYAERKAADIGAISKMAKRDKEAILKLTDWSKNKPGRLKAKKTPLTPIDLKRKKLRSRKKKLA